jgi:hypothetical protein
MEIGIAFSTCSAQGQIRLLKTAAAGAESFCFWLMKEKHTDREIDEKSFQYNRQCPIFETAR